MRYVNETTKKPCKILSGAEWCDQWPYGKLAVILSDCELEMLGRLYAAEPADLRAAVTFEMWMRCRHVGAGSEDRVRTEREVPKLTMKRTGPIDRSKNHLRPLTGPIDKS